MNDNHHLKEYSLAETKRHKPCLIYCGHRYVQDKIQNRTIYWRCEDRAHCNGRAHQLVGNGSLPILTIKHNHPPIIDDLSRHDIVTVDSHRRRRRQNRKTPSQHITDKGDILVSIPTSTMTSPVKLENSNKQQQHTSMNKNLHLSEVITTAASLNLHRHNKMDPIEMTKLLSNITTTSTNSSLKRHNVSSITDQPSRVNHFSWEEIEGRYLPVIFRNENGIYQRYTSKMYVENTLFQSESWQRHSIIARSLPPLVSYSYTEYELKLFRFIIEWHLASLHFKTILPTDCLIRFEDLLDFYNTLRKLRDNMPTVTYNRPIAPLPPPPSSSASSQSFELPTQIGAIIKQQPKVPLLPQDSNNRPQQQSLAPKPPKESGWVQINNVFVPYIVKIKLRENELNKCHTRQPTPQLQREFYVPYEILIKCNIFSDNDFLFKKFLIKATQEDFDMLNNLIKNINIFDEKVPEKTLLVNLFHVMVGLNQILYIKFLPTKQPRTQVNKYHVDVLTHKGGTLLFNGNRLIPYIVQNNRYYVPLLYTFHSLPNILLQAKHGARAPRQYEIDYLNLLFIYFSIETSPLTSDTLLVDIFNIKCSNLQVPIHFRTLQEHQQYEKNKLLNSIKRTTPSTNSSTKTNKCLPTNVVVNPMIHHPSFYGLTSLKQGEIKSIIFENHSLNAIVKTSDVPIHDWKISIKEIFQKYSFNIDYEKFIQWCQINLLLPLIKLDDEEKKILINNSQDDYYVYQKHLDRCIALLNDLQRGSISMTLLPSSNNETQQTMVKSPLAGAKKRKTTVPITRHTSTINESNPATNCIPQEIEHSVPSLPDEVNPPVTNDNSIESSNEQITCPIVDDNDDDDDLMPIVVFVEEEQPLEDLNQTEADTSFVIVETTDGDDEEIQLHDTKRSSSSDGESSTVLTNIDNNIHEENNEKTSKEQPSTNPLIKPKKVNKRHPRYKYGKSRARSRSSTPRNVKRQRSVDDQTSLVTIITRDQIEQHLRTLFMSLNESKRTRTRPVKTPTRLVEEIHINNSTKIIEPDTNVFDILSSPNATDTESTSNQHQPCTYNVVITNKPNKLGLTIKKVVQS